MPSKKEAVKVLITHVKTGKTKQGVAISDKEIQTHDARKKFGKDTEVTCLKEGTSCEEVKQKTLEFAKNNPEGYVLRNRLFTPCSRIAPPSFKKAIQRKVSKPQTKTKEEGDAK